MTNVLGSISTALSGPAFIPPQEGVQVHFPKSAAGNRAYPSFPSFRGR